jgi:hypothetical protein
MNIQAAQAELRRSYLGGGVGAIVSGMVWLIASLATHLRGLEIGFPVLFFGGMLIFPMSELIERLVLKLPKPSKDNPGGRTVVETVPAMIALLLVAWLLLPTRPEIVFPLAAIAVGTHYFGFRTAYGDSLYWGLAVVLCAIGSLAIFVGQPHGLGVPIAVGLAEIVFGIVFIARSRSESSSS